MDQPPIKLNSDQFNRLFPFHLLVDENLKIIAFGKSLFKICNISGNNSFTSLFSLKRPEISDPDFQDLLNLQDQLVILESKKDRDLIFRGQFEILADSGDLLFLGSPWLNSMDLVKGKNLTLMDFAIHDPMIDLLHVIKTQEIVTDDLKELLIINKKQKEELKEAAEKIQTFALFPMQNPDPILRIDQNGRIVIMNPVASGFKSFTYKGKDYDAENFWKEIAPRIEKNDDRWSFEAESDGKIYSFICMHLEKEGYINIYGRDITQAKIKDENLRLLSLIAEENINAVVICNAEGRIDWVNKSYMKITGYTLDELIGQKPGPMLQGPESDPETINHLSTQIKNGEPFNCEIINYSKTGRKYWIHILGQALRNPEGNITGYFALEEDVTEEKETQQKIMEFEKRFRHALEKIGDNVWEYNFRTDKTVFSNPKDNFLGLNFEDVNQNYQLWWNTIHKDDLPILIENDRKCRNLESDFHTLEYRMVLPDGTIKWVLDRGVVIEKESDGQPLRIVGTHSDITSKKNAELALKIKEEKYRNIIENINLGLIEVDNEERIKYANKGFCKMSGYEISDLIEKKPSDIFVERESRNLIESKNDLRRRGISDAYEVLGSNKKGEKRWWLISGAPNYDDNGNLIGSIGIFLDITEKKKLETDLKKAKDKAEKSSKAKETFLANMSHEIRTPLNAIIGMIRELSKEKFTEKQKFFLGNTKTAAEHLLSIINNILDISKIEAGEFKLEEHSFNLGELIEDTISIMSVAATEKLLDLEVKISDKLPRTLTGDPTRIKQILINILGNAIKFTEKGKITVHCRSVENVKNFHKIILSVSDTGIGMEKSYLKNLFSKFSQEDYSTARRFGGTGLGMAISYELVKLMKGSITVDSEKGKGTKVEIRFRLKPGKIEDIETKIDVDRIETLKGLKILVVEDNEMNRLVAKSVLADYGMQVSEAVNGLESIKMLEDEEFDLVFMDLQMPVMDGLTATRIIRNELKIKTPIVALTANPFKKELERCVQAGMNDVVVKPFEEKILIGSILRNIKGQEIEYHMIPEREKKPASFEKLYDLSNLMAMLNNNKEKAAQIVQVFIDNTETDIGLLRKSWEEKDYSQIGMIFHKIKAPVGLLKIQSLSELISDGEKIANNDPENPLLKKTVEKVIHLLPEVVIQLKKDELFQPT